MERGGAASGYNYLSNGNLDWTDDGAAMTTIEALNATGVVYAVQNGATHVSVRPVGATMEDWINAGASSILTQAVKSVVIKRDGGY